MVSTDQRLGLSNESMGRLLKSPAPRFISVLRQSGSLNDLFRRIALHSIQPTLSVEERTQVLVVVNIPDRHFGIVKGRGHRLLKNVRVVEWSCWAASKLRNVDRKKSLVGTLCDDLAVLRVGFPTFARNATTIHAGLVLAEPISSATKTTMAGGAESK